MIQLKYFETIPANVTCIYVLDPKLKRQSELIGVSDSYVSSFLKSEKQQDYIKTEDAFVFLVKTQSDNEKMRAQGAEVYEKIKKETSQLYISGEQKFVEHLVEGLLLASYQFLPYFTDKKEKINTLKEVFVEKAMSESTLEYLSQMYTAVSWTRDRVNEPVSHLNAFQLSQEIHNLCQLPNMTVQILEKAQIESLKMGGLLAVNKGSIDPPTFTIINYNPPKAKNKKPIILVGKGVVYDTGGLSLKPTPGSMDVMKSDMAGAACVVGAIYLAAAQKLDLHIIALIPATDNRPGQNAYTPGDVITMFDGTTVEVLNTDAEGRMILADALSYSNKYKPELVIDAATLTGAAVRAIGTGATIVMGNAKDKIFEDLEKSGISTHERVVRFPFWDEYKKEMLSSIADLKNIGGPNAGMITAGKFLEHFVKAPYIHMDIAGPSWLDSADSYRTKGGTGVGVRLLYNFLKNYN